MTSLEPHELVHYGAAQLAALVRSGDISAAELLEIHLRRIDAINPRLHALVMPTYDRAQQQAEAVDAARARGESLPPLAGVPVSIKECFHVAGLPTTLGLPHRLEQLEAEDSPLVRQLSDAGGLILGKTNVPQLLWLQETDGPLFSRANHPLDATRSPGGSSGGEAALIAAGGSALGLGSDLAGSLRQPAHSCGIQTLMPTPGRLSRVGCLTAFPELPMAAEPGPMARRVEDLELAMRVLVGSQAAAHPWTEASQVDLSKLRIGFFPHDGVFQPAPAVARAVSEAADYLRARGATVETFEPPNMADAVRLFFQLLSSDGGATARHLLAGDPLHWQVRRLLWLARMPHWTRPPIAAVLRLLGQPGMAKLVRNTGPASAERMAQLLDEHRRYVARFMASLAERRFDALLLPPHALPALTHGSFVHVPTASSSTILPNLLGLPAGVVAWTTVRRGEETLRPATSDRVERSALAVEANSAGLPIGVQVLAAPWREDIVLAVMRALERPSLI